MKCPDNVLVKIDVDGRRDAWKFALLEIEATHPFGVFIEKTSAIIVTYHTTLFIIKLTNS